MANSSVIGCPGSGEPHVAEASRRHFDPRQLPPASRHVVIEQNALRRSLDVIILARPKSPEEASERQGTKSHCRDHKKDQATHFIPYLVGGPAMRRRNALRTTIIEEEDIATAAISGVIIPAAAKGRTTRL